MNEESVLVKKPLKTFPMSINSKGTRISVNAKGENILKAFENIFTKMPEFFEENNFCVTIEPAIASQTVVKNPLPITLEREAQNE